MGLQYNQEVDHHNQDNLWCDAQRKPDGSLKKVDFRYNLHSDQPQSNPEWDDVERKMVRNHTSLRPEDHRCTIPEVDNDQTSKFNADRDFDAGVTHRSANEVNQNNENAKVNKKNISCTEVNDVGTQLARQGWWRQDPHPQNEQESRLQFGEAHRFTRDDRLLSDSPLENATEGREPYFGAT